LVGEHLRVRLVELLARLERALEQSDARDVGAVVLGERVSVRLVELLARLERALEQLDVRDVGAVDQEAVLGAPGLEQVRVRLVELLARLERALEQLDAREFDGIVLGERVRVRLVELLARLERALELLDARDVGVVDHEAVLGAPGHEPGRLRRRQAASGPRPQARSP